MDDIALTAPIYLASPKGAGQNLRQCEIISEINQLIISLESVGKDEVDARLRHHPFALILSQDCDLEQDFKARNGDIPSDKLMPSILFCEVFTAVTIRATGGINNPIWNRVKQNKDERYHFLQKIDAAGDSAGEGIPELCVDFKKYFTIPTDEVYRRIEIGEARRRSVLTSPYLEHFSGRFAYYLSRIALPLDHASD